MLILSKKPNLRKYRGATFAIAVILFLFSAFRFHSGTSGLSVSKTGLEVREGPRISKASMLYGPQNDIYDRAIESHKRHNEIHGYNMHVLRRGVTNGYWNKYAYLLSLVVQELAKPTEERIEWIMWVDANNILINPQIPLKIFLPPPDEQFKHVNFLGSKSAHGLNVGAFFLRVSPWSVKLLVKAMALPMIDPTIDLGYNMDEASLKSILDEEDFRPGALYQPRTWFNMAQTREGFEGRSGDLLAQFPGSLEGSRWKSMADWLAELQSHAEKWEKPVGDTSYESEIDRYWSFIRNARGVLHDAETKADELKDGATDELDNAIFYLKEVIATEAFNQQKIEEAVIKLRNYMPSSTVD